LFEDVDEVLGLDVGEVVTDDNGSLVRLSALESPQDEGMELVASADVASSEKNCQSDRP